MLLFLAEAWNEMLAFEKQVSREQTHFTPALGMSDRCPGAILFGTRVEEC